MKLTIKNILLGVFVGALIVTIFGAVFFWPYLKNRSIPEFIDYFRNLMQEPQNKIDRYPGGFSPNYENPNILVGDATNVFVAKISNQMGNESVYDFSARQLNAEVVYNIKGNVVGNLIINDFAGGEEMKAGSTYLIIASGPTQEGRYNTSVREGGSSRDSSIKLITTDAALTRDQLVELAEKDDRVQELLVAYVYEEMPNAMDPASRPNSFQTLSEEQKSVVLSKIKNLPPPPLHENTRELCSDKRDNDNDGYQDLADVDCTNFKPPFVSENTKALCSDHVDNDGDARWDLNDPDCAAFIPFPSPQIQPPPPPTPPSATTSTAPVAPPPPPPPAPAPTSTPPIPPPPPAPTPTSTNP